MDLTFIYPCLLGVLIFLLLLFTHLASIRVVKRLKVQLSMQLLLMVNVLALALPLPLLQLLLRPLLWPERPLTVSTLIYTQLLYFALAYSYFHLFNMSETARRVKLLTLIAERGRQLRPNELQLHYTREEMVAVRLQRLVGLGEIVELQGRYHLRRKFFLTIHSIMQWWRGVLFNKRKRSKG